MKIGLIVLATLVAAAIGACAFAGVTISRPPTPIQSSTAVSAPTTVAGSTQAADPPSKAAQKAATGIVDGEWLVGTDVPAGRYHAPPGANCYWQLATTPGARVGEPGFITNAAPVGPAYVMLRAGQYFQTSGCGLWTKV